MYLDVPVLGVIVYFLVVMWLGLSQHSPIHDWSNEHTGLWALVFLVVVPALFWVGWYLIYY